MPFGNDKISQAFEKRLKEYEEKVEEEKKQAREQGRIYVEASDLCEWKIHDIDGYYAFLTTQDWHEIQRYINENLYEHPSEVFLNEMLEFIGKTVCKDCRQKCEKCAVKELKNAIERRLPYDEAEDY